MCEVLGVSRSGFYAWRDRPPSPTAVRRGHLVEQIRAVDEAALSAYGSPRVHRELEARGLACCENTVAKLMRANGSRHDRPVAENLLAREFCPERPDAVWAADITHIPTAEGRLYLAAVI